MASCTRIYSLNWYNLCVCSRVLLIASTVIFGEIVPQSICVRFGLPIGAWMSPFVLALMYIMAPIAWPTAKLLDFLLGEDHGTMYKKAGLKTLVSLHKSLGESGQRLHADEVTIISAVLDLKEKPLGSIMTPMDLVFTLSLDDVLDEDTMDDILSKGYSRIPVHHPDNDENFVGMLLVKMLITYDPEDAKPVRDFALATLPETKPNTSCLDIMNFFQEGKSHMVLVSTHPGEDHGAIGVVTLEDVIEELIGEEIVDESDVFIDVQKAIRRGVPAARTRFPKEKAPPAATDVAVNGNAPDLIDINEGEALDHKDLQRVSTLDAPPRDSAAPQRRLSANGSLADGRPLKKLTNSEDIKEQFKHLGPSNLASRPKQTRYLSVKIKPGVSPTSPVRADSNPRANMPRRVSESASEFGGGIGEGVLPSGGRPASDGVQALAVGYGAISSSPNDKRSPGANKAVQTANGRMDGSDSPEAKSKNGGLKPPSQSDDSDGDTLGDLPHQHRPRSPYVQSRGPARSGSITENIVDTNGIRKVVLETTSSSESNEEDSPSGTNKGSSSFLKQTSEDYFESSKQAGSDKDEAAQGADSVSKKKKRRRKKGKQSTDETSPLLLN